MSDEERSIAGEVQGSIHGEQNDISNADQTRILNFSIHVALKKQSDNFLQYLDSRISQLKPTPLPVDDFTFKGEGNRIQFKFNSDRSAKLSEILDCVKTGKFDSLGQIIKS